MKIYYIFKKNLEVLQTLLKVVTGEYSYVDPLGTRHTVVYKADEKGFRILETREEKGFVKVDTPEEIRIKKNKKEGEKHLLKEKKKKALQTLTLRVPKVKGGRGSRPRAPRRRKLIRVVKRPKSVSSELFQPVAFTDPGTTQVVDLKTVPQRIELPPASVSAGAQGPIKLQRNLFFVPLKFPSQAKGAKAEKATIPRGKQYLTTSTTTQSVLHQAGKSVVVLKRNQKQPIRLPAAKVLKSVPPSEQTPDEEKEPEVAADVEAKNRHIDPKSFRTNMLKLKTGRVRLSGQKKRGQVPAPLPVASLVPTQTAAQPSVVANPATRVVFSPAVRSPPSRAAAARVRPVFGPSLAPAPPQVLPSAAAPVPAPLPGQLPPANPITPDVRLLPAVAPLFEQEGQKADQEAVAVSPPRPRPILRFISLPPVEQGHHGVAPPSPASAPAAAPSQQVRLIPFATFAPPQQQLGPVVASNNEHELQANPQVLLGPQFSRPPQFVHPTEAKSLFDAAPQQNTVPIREPQVNVGPQFAEPIQFIRRPETNSLFENAEPEQPTAHLGVQPQQQQQQQHSRVLEQPLQPVGASPFFVQLHPVSFAQGAASPFLRVIPRATFLPSAAPGPVTGVTGGPFPEAGPSRVSFRSPTINYEY